MGMYTIITITGPNEDVDKVKLDKLPDFELHDKDPWDLYAVDRRWLGYDEATGQQMFEETPLAEHYIHMAGHSKWDPEDTSQWAMRFTRKRPTLQVVVRKEWDNRDADNPGLEEDTFRGGEWIKAESKLNGEVPANLPELLAAGERALIAYHMPVGDEQTVIEGLANSLEALVKGLKQ